MASSIYQELPSFDNEKYKGRGLTGLSNLGNTCFMNACLQCLSHTYILRELLTNEQFVSKLETLSEGTLIKEWATLNNLMWSENCVISCDRWLESVQKKAQQKGQILFTGYNQNDCCEFIMFMLEQFHEELKRQVKMTINGQVINNSDKLAIKCFDKIKSTYEKEYSEMINIFFGVQLMRIKSKTIPVTTHVENPEMFFILNLSIPETTVVKNAFSLDDCFKYSMESEILEGDNAWYNETTKQKEDVFIEHCYWKLPMIMIVCLKRFNNYGRKINNYLTMALDNKSQDGMFSIVIDMSPYVESHTVGDSNTYEVYGFCIHSGGTLGGHYFSVVKNASGKWYIYNDQSVKLINNPDTDIPNLYSKSYCLFMKKI